MQVWDDPHLEHEPQGEGDGADADDQPDDEVELIPREVGRHLHEPRDVGHKDRKVKEAGAEPP